MLRLRPAAPRPVDLDQIRHDYLKVLRAWHVAWMARVERHRDHLQPIALRDQGFVYDCMGPSATFRPPSTSVTMIGRRSRPPPRLNEASLHQNRGRSDGAYPAFPDT